MEYNIGIKDLFNTLKKRWLLILLFTLGAGLISAGISYYVLTPAYQASTQILVNQKKTDDQALNITQVQTNVELINTYSVIIKSPTILEEVIKELDLKSSVKELNQKITVNSQANSQVLSLTVEDTNADNATKIANTLSDTFQKEIKSIMNVDNVTVLSKATLKENSNPVKPNISRNIVFALAIGLMLGIGLSFLREYMDNTIKDERDVEKILELPVLTSIQRVSEK
ncbi:YveK family protein [Priestia sp. YIM B13448]|uniref:YveK family protein n=1 Tax=Priestia sp. YIM B13448 TaxID=3366308 RepID=UPI003672797E